MGTNNRNIISNKSKNNRIMDFILFFKVSLFSTWYRVFAALMIAYVPFDATNKVIILNAPTLLSKPFSEIASMIIFPAS